jgi:hypothetical protein
VEKCSDDGKQFFTGGWSCGADDSKCDLDLSCQREETKLIPYTFMESASSDVCLHEHSIVSKDQTDLGKFTLCHEGRIIQMYCCNNFKLNPTTYRCEDPNPPVGLPAQQTKPDSVHVLVSDEATWKDEADKEAILYVKASDADPNRLGCAETDHWAKKVHPFDCSRYINCNAAGQWGGQAAEHKKCPDAEAFDGSDRWGSCKLAADSVCAADLLCASEETKHIPFTLNEPGKGTCSNHLARFREADEVDEPNEFFLCSAAGLKIKMYCCGNLVYDQTTERCK